MKKKKPSPRAKDLAKVLVNNKIHVNIHHGSGGKDHPLWVMTPESHSP